MAAHDGQVTSPRLREILELEPLEKPVMDQAEGATDPPPIRLEEDDAAAEAEKNQNAND